METFEYKIGGIEFLQSELTWKNDKKLVRLYGKVQSAAFKNEELKLKDLQPMLAKYKLLPRFFAIILQPKLSIRYIISFKWIPYLLGKVNLDQFTNSEISQIFKDFFLLNQKFAMQLGELANALGLIASEAENKKTEK